VFLKPGNNTLRNRLHVTDFVVIRNVGVGTNLSRIPVHYTGAMHSPHLDISLCLSSGKSDPEIIRKIHPRSILALCKTVGLG